MTSPPRFVVVANEGCPRLAFFEAALQQRGLAAPSVVYYRDLLVGKIRLQDVVGAGDIVRLESPGRDWEVEKALLRRGVALTEAESYFRFLTVDEVEALDFDKGRIWPSRQWFRGFSSLMGELADQLSACPPHFATHSPAEIVTMFDKPKCHFELESNGIAVPPSLPVPSHFEALWENMRARNWQRVFIKLAHGSSASGVVAFQTDGKRVKATTTVEIVQTDGEIRLYNSRRLRTYETWSEIETLVNALGRERVHVERWFPKASLNGQTCDLRLLSIDRRVWSGVVRQSRGPITNLHLLNERAPLAELENKMRPDDWQLALCSCETATALFPGSLSCGLDVAFAPNFRRHAILELNPWGDLLKGTIQRGLDSYEAQIEAAMAL